MPHYFTNETPLDKLFLTQFGLSVKEEDAIGQFGTGLKYAIATIIRGGGKITIRSENRHYTFGYRVAWIKDQFYNIITASENWGDPFDLPFTKALGKNWEPWMAYRELWANAKDEGGTSGTTPNPAATTEICVDWEEFDEIDLEHKFFDPAGRTPRLRGDSLDIYDRTNSSSDGCAYYKGILVQEGLHFTYFLKTDAWQRHLTEDRTIKYSWIVPELASGEANATKDAETIIQYWEDAGATERQWIKTPPKEVYPEFLTAALSGRIRGPEVQGVVAIIEKDMPVKLREPTDPEARAIDKAATFLALAKVDITNIPLQIIERANTRILGQANSSTIILTASVFEHGIREIAKTLLEEYIHIKYNCIDETREMQEAFLEEWMSAVSKTTGEIL